MRIGKPGSLIKTLIQPLRDLGATEAADNINCLSVLFNELKDIEADEFTKVASRLEISSGRDKVLVGDVAKSLSAVADLAKACGATSAKISSLKTAFACVASPNLEHVPFIDFVKSIKASFLVDVVTLHLSALESSLGTPRFDAAFNALEQDRRVKKPELGAIASSFVSQTSRSAAKRQTLQRIYARHAALVDSANKREWQKGKSAA